MTPTTPRLRELIRAAEDTAADTSQPYAQIETARDTAAALRELLKCREGAAYFAEHASPHRSAR